jgi:hypothetical protein
MASEFSPADFADNRRLLYCLLPFHNKAQTVIPTKEGIPFSKPKIFTINLKP